MREFWQGWLLGFGVSMLGVVASYYHSRWEWREHFKKFHGSCIADELRESDAIGSYIGLTPDEIMESVRDPEGKAGQKVLAITRAYHKETTCWPKGHDDA